MGILILSVRDIIMKVLFLLCAVVAAVSANAVPNTCQAHDNLIKKLAKEVSSHYPADVSVRGECSDGEGFACVGTILQTFGTASDFCQSSFHLGVCAGNHWIRKC